MGDAVDGGSKNGGLENALMGWIGRGNGRGQVDLDVVGGEGGGEGLSNTNSDDLNFGIFDSAFDFFASAFGFLALVLSFSDLIDLDNAMAPPLPRRGIRPLWKILLSSLLFPSLSS